jgi:hypothetical protein
LCGIGIINKEKTMRIGNRKLWICFLAVAAVFVMSRAAAQERGGRGPGGTEVRGTVKTVDTGGMKITIAVPPPRDAARDAPASNPHSPWPKI